MSGSFQNGSEGDISEYRKRQNQERQSKGGFEIQPSSGGGCCVIALGASLALGSFGAICSLAKADHSKPSENDKSSLVIEEQPKTLKAAANPAPFPQRR